MTIADLHPEVQVRFSRTLDVLIFVAGITLGWFAALQAVTPL